MRTKLKLSERTPRVNVNKHLAKLLTGYQDLVDRYGPDDALVRELKAEIDRYQLEQHLPLPPASERHGPLADAWERHSEIASL